jgi:hypothetical protein
MNSPPAKTQIGTIVVGAGAGLAICAIIFTFVLKQQSGQPLVQVSS